ncbi:MAG: SDR family oxidoreductase [Burkholderiaceae bacterium]|jgi:dTDP-4-dehydrorhamnose reductase
MRSHILITGGAGLLALNWALAMRDRYSVVLGQHVREVRLTGIKNRRVSLESVDVVVAALEDIQPEAVIHTAGLTSIEKCEEDEARALYVNSELAENVAKACAKMNIPLVHISTDHLFSGEHASADEATPVQPLNVYAKTKADAEVRVMQAWPEALVIRTNFYCWGPSYRRSFSDTIIESLRAGKRLTLFKDVHYTPIVASELAGTCHELLDRQESGIFHVVGDESLSKYDFGHAIAEVFALDSSLISPGLIVERPSLVPRPLDMSLSNAKVRQLLGRSLGRVPEQLAILRAQEANGYIEELMSL